MNISDNSYSLPTELELKRYFYDYHHHAVSGDNRSGDILSAFDGFMSVPNGVPYNYSGPISMFNKFDEDLGLYSVYGVGALDVFGTKEERMEYKDDIKLAKRELYK